MPAAGQTIFQIAPVGKMIFVVVEIHRKRKSDLFEVGKTDCPLAFLFRASERGQEQRGQNGDDGDDDKQFNQREGIVNFIRSARHIEMQVA
jgi:hypothetical protein